MSLSGAKLHSPAIILGCDGVDGPLLADLVPAMRQMPGRDTGNPPKTYCPMKISEKNQCADIFSDISR
jgi:hypothetical protein